ncbi:C-type mannose receptor 2-like [Sebastes umbrosus]|uniref:C-type mannose receptor 2-like n=1 Tax=Sebastes umbrosus TaxID=72105 RepID=UPI00189CC183|nr:C-type mannose receptor 2-like [Sebastes umbrosus]
MQWSLFLLILMGQCSFLVCHLYEYHFIEETKTWEEAQTYCRAHYTDLATVFDMTDMTAMKRLRGNNQSEAWIGLRNHPDAEGTWHWSLPGMEFNKSETRWAEGEPNNIKHPENCVRMDHHEWKDVPCTIENLEFICYDAKQPNEKFHLIKIKMTWPQAQNYCREHHTDLASGLQQIEDEEFKKDETQSNKSLWIGLFNDTWKWSDESNFSFRNWQRDSWSGSKECAVTKSNDKWMKRDCAKRKPFFCYEDNVILIKESKTWEEALYYCQDHYHDLVSITNLDEQRWVQERAKMANTPHVWLGLRYTCTLGFWFWISDEAVEYKNWDSPGQTDECDMSGAMDRGGQHKWFKKIDHGEFNFICSME